MKIALMMEVKEENQRMADLFKGRVVKNRTLLPIPFLKGSEFSLTGYPKGKIVIEAYESGGSVGESVGECQVVCDINGSALRPVFLVKEGHLKNADHACFNFSASRGLTIINIVKSKSEEYKKKRKITYTIVVSKINGIRSVSRQKNMMKLDIETRVLSYDNYQEKHSFLDDLPLDLSRYKNAINIAMTKVDIKNCEDALFYLTHQE